MHMIMEGLCKLNYSKFIQELLNGIKVLHDFLRFGKGVTWVTGKWKQH